MRLALALMLFVPVTAFGADAEDEAARAAVAVQLAKLKLQTPDVKPQPAAPVGDPYGYASYDDFYRAVASGIKGVLVVGIEDRYVQSYTAHCRVPSGAYGLADGEYDCFPLNGVPQLEPRGKAVSQKARPFLGDQSSTRATAANRSAGQSLSSPVPAPYRVLTGTTARAGTVFTTENCGPVG